MESNQLLQFNPDTKEYVKKLYGLDKSEKMKQAVEILQEWLKKQDHFTKKEYERKYLESTLLDTKGSIEKAKNKLEKRCVFRTVLPHFFAINDFNAEFGELMADSIAGFPLPQLTKEHYRVVVYKVYDTEFFRNLSFFTYYKLSFLLNEYLKLHDFCAGYIYLLDVSEVNIIDIVSKIKPIEFKQWSTYFYEVQGMRLKKFIYITPSKTIDTLVKLIKPLFNKKMSERIEVYKNIEEIVDMFPREMWPIELGGKTEISARKNQENWVKTLSSKEFMGYYNDMCNARVDEKIKNIDGNDKIKEMAGSFVSLNFD